jgi:hypothetical protein
LDLVYFIVFTFVTVHLKVNHHLTINQVVVAIIIIIAIVTVAVGTTQDISLQEVKNDVMMIVVIVIHQKNISIEVFNFKP